MGLGIIGYFLRALFHGGGAGWRTYQSISLASVVGTWPGAGLMPAEIAGISSWLIPAGVVVIYVIGAFGHRIWLLEKETEPLLELTYKPEPPYIRIDKENGKKVGREHRVKVKNLSEVRRIDDVGVYIKSVHHWDHVFSNTPLGTVQGKEIFNLNAGAEEYVTVFVAEDKRNSEFLVWYANDKLKSSLPRHLSAICIEAQGKGVPSVRLWVKPESTPAGKLLLKRIYPDEPWREGQWKEWVGVG